MLSRRKLLQSASALAIAGLPSQSLGWIHGSAASGKTLIGGFETASGYSYAFENLFKLNLSQPSGAAGFLFASVLDNNGYPTGTTTSSVTYGLVVPPAWGTQSLTFAWQGTGAIFYHPSYGISNVTIVSGTGITNNSNSTFVWVIGTNVQVTFNLTTQSDSLPQQFTFPTGTYSSMSNLVLCRTSYTGAGATAVIANPNLFNPDWVALQKALNPKVLRLMDTSGANNANHTSFSQRAPTTALSYGSSATGAFYRYIPSAWAGTVSGTNTYTLSAPSGWGGLVDGAIVHFFVPTAQANTVNNPTLNVGGTGAIQITDSGPNTLANSYLTGVDGGGNAQMYTATYSAVYNYWTTTPGGLSCSVPLELHIAAANAVNAHCWYNLSHRWPTSDASSIVSLVKSNLNSQLKFYVELSNEVWNVIFSQTSYLGAITQGPLGVGGSSNPSFGYALYYRRIMGAISTAWGLPDPRLVRVLAFQAFGDPTGIDSIRFQGSQLATVAQGGIVPNSGAGNTVWTNVFGAPNYTGVGQRPIDFCDSLSYATYTAGGQLLDFTSNYPSTQPFAGSPFTAVTVAGISVSTTPSVTYSSDPGYATGYRVQFQNVTGMTQINNQNVTLRRDTPTSYSMFTDSSLSTAYNTSTYSAFSSGQTLVYPEMDGLTAWADLYATGIPANMASALSSVDTDLRSGTNYGRNISGGTLLVFNGASTGQGIYAAWHAKAVTYSVNVECYEGGLEISPPDAAGCTTLGISTSYAAKIGTLITAYKNSSLFSQYVQDQSSQFHGTAVGLPNFGALTHNKTYAWYTETGPNLWGFLTGDLYSGPSSLGAPFSGTPYQSYNGLVVLNH